MTADAQLFYSIVSEAPPASSATEARERRRSFRRPLGTVATITRVLNGEEHNRLHVLLMNRSEEGIGLRCPIGLVRDGIYRLQIGADPAESTLIRITSSRPREDETFDVGAQYA
jgi:hypothetical protein